MRAERRQTRRTRERGLGRTSRGRSKDARKTYSRTHNGRRGGNDVQLLLQQRAVSDVFRWGKQLDDKSRAAANSADARRNRNQTNKQQREREGRRRRRRASAREDSPPRKQTATTHYCYYEPQAAAGSWWEQYRRRTHTEYCVNPWCPTQQHLVVNATNIPHLCR